MKLKELIETFGLSEKEIGDINLSPEQVLVHRETNSGDSGRELAVVSMIRERTSFSSEANIFRTMAETFIRLKCPVCYGALGGRFNGGSGNQLSYAAKCTDCNVTVRLSMPSDGIRITFDDKPV